jgi:hypothetical protein
MCNAGWSPVGVGMLDRSVWDVAVQSISDWKNGYVSECEDCAARPQCAGFFLTRRLQLSRGVKPVPAALLGGELCWHAL